MTVYHHIVLKKFPESFFGMMLNGMWMMDKNGVEVPRDGSVFKYVKVWAKLNPSLLSLYDVV